MNNSPLYVSNSCSALINEMQLPDNFDETVSNIYLPLTHIIADRKKDRPLLVSINGAQGTGKSTMTTFLKHILESESKYKVADLSLDDFYSRRSDRIILADKVHPLFVTRGVPGTHDVALIEQVLGRLLDRQPCSSPRFNKAMDDRCAEPAWQQYSEPVDIILFEGWCNNSPVQTQAALQEPVNALERDEDAQGVWRQYANERLAEYQQRIFNNADFCIMLKVPDFECVTDWRTLQEQKLREKNKANKLTRIMDEAELKRFVQHYERISRHTLATLPAIADVVLPVDRNHKITAIVQNQNSADLNRLI
ncbi:MAG: hypothetical protein IMF17_06005 [Proteobacteria bacterium]|nr:hypothetical protein [Pseudomonadota bacterium]